MQTSRCGGEGVVVCSGCRVQRVRVNKAGGRFQFQMVLLPLSIGFVFFGTNLLKIRKPGWLRAPPCASSHRLRPVPPPRPGSRLWMPRCATCVRVACRRIFVLVSGFSPQVGGEHVHAWQHVERWRNAWAIPEGRRSGVGCREQRLPHANGAVEHASRSAWRVTNGAMVIQQAARSFALWPRGWTPAQVHMVGPHTVPAQLPF